MTEVERLRALLAEAESYVDRDCSIQSIECMGATCEHRVLRKRIDAALAEPVGECADCANSFRLAGTRERERDEARAALEKEKAAHRLEREAHDRRFDRETKCMKERDEARLQLMDAAVEALKADKALTQLRNERDEARAEVERLTQSLAMAEQVSGVLCDACGWAMKFPGEPCRCEIVKQLDETRAEVRRTYIELSEAISRNAEAYERGAEAMREAAARHFDKTYGVTRNPQEVIRALPLPKEKP